ncbi:unnamed protein product, partial [marine sediment metagenome]
MEAPLPSTIIRSGFNFTAISIPSFILDIKILPPKPTLSIIGTGKRIGKTAVSSYISKIYARQNVNVCVVAMGRGGPESPQIIRGDKIDITPEYLLGISNKGMHASSDYIEEPKGE